MPPENRPIDWWLEKVEGAYQTSDGWKAICPAHRDVKASLSLKENGDDTLVHCFAGCEYGDILRAVENGRIQKPTIRVQPSAGVVEAGKWWEEYTNVPASEWEALGVIFKQGSVIFTWSSTPIRKNRKAGTKDFTWGPRGFSSPPLWPSVPDHLPPRIFITEGESDCGVLRHLGYTAFCVTKGAETPDLEPTFRKLKTLGVMEVVPAFDNDSAGQSAQAELVRDCVSAGITPLPLWVSEITDPLIGEKDIRDVWIRIKDPDAMRRLINAATPTFSATRKKVEWRSLDDFMASPITNAPWIVEKVILSNTVGMIVGAPKMGKSWLALDLAASVASGKPFLGFYKVPAPGPVVVITKEDPDHLLQDRLGKILVSKGYGGKYLGGRILFPQPLPNPIMFDLSRSFLFTDKDTQRLMERLAQYKEQFGSLSLVIFDPILKMLAGIDEYKASEIAESVFATSQQIQTQLGSAVVLIHHRSKGGIEGKSSYGSMAFHAFSESTLYLKGDQPDKDGWVNVEGEYKSAPTTTWSFRFLDLEHKYEVEVSETEKSKGGAGDISAKILDLLDQVPEGLTVDQLADGIPEVKEGSIRQCLKILEQSNKVKSEKLPASGPGPRKDNWKKVV